jgi:large subunit ribosomal protein L13
MGTFMAKAETVERKWYVVDADGQPLGRLASQIAAVLRGKNKPTFTPHVECGDFVIVINCEKVLLTGKKADKKTYVHHSGYVGGLKERSFKTVLAKEPDFPIVHAVKGMLPRSILGRQMLRNLRVFKGPEHSHQAQKPEPLVLL